MSKKIRVPLLPESVSDATIAIWIKKVGENIEEEEVLLELETDKVILEVTAPASGILVEIIKAQDAIVHSGDVIGIIKTEQEIQQESAPVNTIIEEEKMPENDHSNDNEPMLVEHQAFEHLPQENEQSMPDEQVVESIEEPIQKISQDQSETEIRQEILQELEQIQDDVPEEATTELPIVEVEEEQPHQETVENNDLTEIASENEITEIITPEAPEDDSPLASPSVRKAMTEYQLQAGDINGSGKHGKILKEDIEQHLQQTESIIEENGTGDAKDEELPLAESLVGGEENAEEIISPIDPSPEPINEEQVAIDSTNEEDLVENGNQIQEVEAVIETMSESSVEEQQINKASEPQIQNDDNEVSHNEAEEVTPMDENSESEQAVNQQQVSNELPVNEAINKAEEITHLNENSESEQAVNQQQVSNELPVNEAINKAEEITHLDENSESEQAVDQQQVGSDLPVIDPQNNEAKTVANSSERRVPMTRIRAKIAERLVEAQQNAAILTTFNDVDLSEIIRLRKIYRDRFEQVHNIKLGFMSFFVKAATEALKRYPEVNARIEGQDIIYQGNYDIGVAVSTERGLVVPIVRDTNTLGHADIEKQIHDYAHRARNNQLELNELTGGTFSITNGGVFGSMLSTPIINPPQSAILGMHKIEDRPVAINGEVVIRPMMYLALSYDHRLIDGKTAVSFLVKIKELLEDPASLFLEL